jgi:hypothetical protein
MSSDLAIAPLSGEETAICALVCNGDAAKLNDSQKTQYYLMRCRAANIDPRTAPFQFIQLQGKLVLYALKTCSDQLASKNNIRVEVLTQDTTPDGIRVVTVRAIAKDGRQTDEIGCVSVKGKMGDDLGNAYMKAMTKAKRRAVLSLCGLGCMDETEVETIPGAKVVPHNINAIRPPQALPMKVTPPPPAATPPEDAPEPGSNDAGEEPLDGIGITEIKFKKGESKKGPWTCYFIHGNDGKCYTTFDDAVSKKAQAAMETGETVLITAAAPKKSKDGAQEFFPIMDLK